MYTDELHKKRVQKLLYFPKENRGVGCGGGIHDKNWKNLSERKIHCAAGGNNIPSSTLCRMQLTSMFTYAITFEINLEGLHKP
jgi:hypothetical protein